MSLKHACKLRQGYIKWHRFSSFENVITDKSGVTCNLLCFTFSKYDNNIQEFTKGQRSAMVLVNQLKHLLNKEGVRSHGEHLSKLCLAQFVVENFLGIIIALVSQISRVNRLVEGLQWQQKTFCQRNTIFKIRLLHLAQRFCNSGEQCLLIHFNIESWSYILHDWTQCFSWESLLVFPFQVIVATIFVVSTEIISESHLKGWYFFHALSLVLHFGSTRLGSTNISIPA